MPTYTYVSVDRVTPSGGTVLGGTAVTITGFGFDFASGVVTFGGTAATSVVIVSNTEITAVTPAHASGAVDVVVVGVDTLTAGYTYSLTQSLLPPIPYPSPLTAEEGKISNPYFLWLTTLKQRVEQMPGSVPAESIIGVLNPDTIPQLPTSRLTFTDSPRLLGRSTAGSGDAEEIRVAGGLVLSGGILSMAGLPSGYVIGDLLYADTDHTLARLADVSVGSYLRSGGVATAPLWSTLKLPNAVTAGSVVFASATNTYGQDNANLFWDDSNNRLGIGTATPSVALQVVGTLLAADGAVGAPTYSYTSDPDTGRTWAGSGVEAFIANGALTHLWAGQEYRLGALGTIGWSASNNPLAGAADTILARDAAATLALRNGTNAQALRVYNTFTNASNFERGIFAFTSNVLTIATEALGTGTVRAIDILSGTAGIRISTLGNVGLGTTSFPSTGTASLIFGDGTVPATMGSNTAGLYADDVGGTTRMFGIDEAGVTGALAMQAANLTSGSVLFAGSTGLVSQSNANFFWNDTTKSLLISGASDANPFEVIGNFTTVSAAHIMCGLTAYGDASRSLLRRANGTSGSPSQILSGEVLGTFIFRGYGSTTFSLNNDGQVRALAAENFTDSAHGTHLEFFTTPIGSVTGALVVRVSSEGNVGIGTTAFPSTGTFGLVFGDGTALSSMGSNTAGFYANDVGGTVNMFAINEAGTVTQLSGLTSAYTITNVTTDRSYDANATTLDEIADTLGTLIADLQARGICG